MDSYPMRGSAQISLLISGEKKSWAASLKKSVTGYTVDLVLIIGLSAGVKKERPGIGVILEECFESGNIPLPDPTCPSHLNPEECLLAINGTCGTPQLQNENGWRSLLSVAVRTRFRSRITRSGHRMGGASRNPSVRSSSECIPFQFQGFTLLHRMCDSPFHHGGKISINEWGPGCGPDRYGQRHIFHNHGEI